ISLSGPTTGASHRDLTGTGWAVGALLRPAGLAQLHPEPVALRDREVAYDAVALQRAITDAMDGGLGPSPSEADAATARERAVEIWTRWALENFAPPDETGLLANAMEDLISTDPTVVRV